MCLNLHQLQNAGKAFENAIDSAFSSDQIIGQIYERLERLKIYSSAYLKKNLIQLILEKIQQFKREYKQNIVFTTHTFSISDLGIHNMLLTQNSYFFIDFEFFGRDSFEKMIGDFLLHPRNTFSKAEVEDYISRISSESTWDYNNLKPALLLLSLKWATITAERLAKEKNKISALTKNSFIIRNSLSEIYLNFFEVLMSTNSPNLNLTFRQFMNKVKF